jgi:hypothetical protein
LLPACAADANCVEIRTGKSSSADQLAQALARNRLQLNAVTDDEERERRTEAIDRLGRYADLLREATAAALARYSFKLEFADGRWDIAEKECPEVPTIGELVDFEDGECWRVRRSQLVYPQPAGKPPHEYFVCMPVS